jgi:uncharacterized protein involved in exopolysaccharide biosynthesis
MAPAQVTPRDKLERLVDLGRKTLRYWWLVALFAVGGGALSLAFALLRTPHYQAEASLSYQERIQSSLLQNREEVVNRNIGDRYRELLMSRPQLIQIINDPKLNPFPDKDPDLALEKLRQQVKFESRGGATFRIVYTDTDPDRAKDVTDRLTTVLQKKDDEMRAEQASATVTFAIQQKEMADTELRKREQALAEFLAKHPEFATEANQTADGAAVRQMRDQKNKSGDDKMYALERQRMRLQARLEASPDAPPIRVAAPPSPEKQRAEAAAQAAEQSYQSALHDLEDALSKYTNKHPIVISAQDRVAAAKEKLRAAKAAVPPDIETPVAPATPADREKLQKELAALESQISEAQKKAGKTSDKSTNWVVQLETEHAELRRQVNEQRETVASLATSVSRAQIDASTKAAEVGAAGRLAVINPAERPTHPTGPGKTIFLLAGMILFITLGGSLAVGLAVIDDRVYRTNDLDPLGITVLGVIPPIAMPKRVKKPRRPAKPKLGKETQQIMKDVRS